MTSDSRLPRRAAYYLTWSQGDEPGPGDGEKKKIGEQIRRARPRSGVGGAGAGLCALSAADDGDRQRHRAVALRAAAAAGRYRTALRVPRRPARRRLAWRGQDPRAGARAAGVAIRDRRDG